MPTLRLRSTVSTDTTVSLFSVMNPVFCCCCFFACLNSVDSIIIYFLAVIFAQVVFSQTKPANWVICWPSLCQLVLLYSLVFYFLFVFLLRRCDQTNCWQPRFPFLVPCSPCCVGLARRLQSNCCLVSYRRGERVSAAITESLPYDLVQNHCQAQVPSPFSWPCEHSPVSPSGPPLGCGTLDLPDAQFWAYRTSSVYPELSVLEVRFVCVIFIK